MTVAFPATPLLLARARICIFAAHSREDLIKALQVCMLNFIKWLSLKKNTQVVDEVADKVLCNIITLLFFLC